jgi:hypothetical protein
MDIKNTVQVLIARFPEGRSREGTKVHGETEVVVMRLQRAAVVELQRATGIRWRDSQQDPREPQLSLLVLRRSRGQLFCEMVLVKPQEKM